MAHVYILYSIKADKYYVGSCKNLSYRLKQHRDKSYSGSYTAVYSDWELYEEIGGLTYKQSRAIEQHIKRMHSRIYIENLHKYPEMVDRLKAQYSEL